MDEDILILEWIKDILGKGAFGEATMDLMVSGGSLLTSGGSTFTDSICESLLVPILFNNGMNLRMSLWANAYVSDDNLPVHEGGFCAVDLSHTLNITSLTFYDADQNTLDPSTYSFVAGSGYGYVHEAPSPVPVPGAIWLLGSGVAGLLCMRWRMIRS